MYIAIANITHYVLARLRSKSHWGTMSIIGCATGLPGTVYAQEDLCVSELCTGCYAAHTPMYCKSSTLSSSTFHHTAKLFLLMSFVLLQRLTLHR